MKMKLFFVIVTFILSMGIISCGNKNKTEEATAQIEQREENKCCEGHKEDTEKIKECCGKLECESAKKEGCCKTDTDKCCKEEK